MNYTFLLIFLIGLSAAFFVGVVFSENEKPLEITNEDQLNLALHGLRERINTPIPITADHVLHLADGNVKKFYIFEANKMTETTYSRSHGEPYDTFFYPNGTRTFTEMSDDGELLKKIIIHDVPKNQIMILIFEE